MPSTTSPRATGAIVRNVVLACLGLAIIWSYATTFGAYTTRWSNDPQYSHGFLVPLFSLAILWMRRGMVQGEPLRPSAHGLWLIAASLAVRVYGARYYYEFLDGASLILLLLGVAWTLGGRRAFAWCWPAVGFLAFMMPMPYSLEMALQGPLRSIGTKVSSFVLQTMGLPAYTQGHVIVVGENRIGVVEACSGLRMLMVFFALSTATVFFSGRFLWEKAVIILSALPIAILVNVGRIAVTGYFYATGHAELAERVFHDLAGWLMMPAALGLLGLELWLLSRIFVLETVEPIVFDASGMPGTAHRTPARASQA